MLRLGLLIHYTQILRFGQEKVTGNERLSSNRQPNERLNVAGLFWCLLSGVLLVFCYPKFDMGLLAWVALIPWLWVTLRGRWWVVVLGSWLTGFIWLAGVMYWIAIFGSWPWILMALVWSSPIMLCGAGIRVLAHRAVWQRMAGPPLLWVSWEWLRSIGPYGLPWAPLGASQADFLPVVQIASLLGVLGISALIVLVNVSILELRRALVQRKQRSLRSTSALVPPIAAILAALLVILWGGVREQTVLPNTGLPAAWEGDMIWVSLIQGGDVDADVSHLNRPWTAQEQDEQMSKYESLTLQAIDPRPDLVIWPESAIPAFLNVEPMIRERVSQFTRKMGSYLLSGSQHLSPQGEIHNSAYLFSPAGRIVGRYDKVHLVPFGEYVPARSWLPFVKYYTIREEDFTAGQGYRLFEIKPGVKMGPMICFESVFPEISRAIVSKGANILVIITNDAWFKRTAAAEQHAKLAIFRAVENGVWVIRSATTGVSCVIDATGNTVGEMSPQFSPLTIGPVPVPALEGRTMWRRGGYLFPEFCIFFSILLLVWRRGKPKRVTKQD